MADEKNSAAVFAQLRFSLDGKFLLAVVEGRIYVLDAFEGTIERKVTSDIPEGGQALEACLTADGKYVLSGCANRSIKSWSVADGSVVAEWTGHAGVPSCLKVGGVHGWRLFCFCACSSIHSVLRENLGNYTWNIMAQVLFAKMRACSPITRRLTP